MNYGFGTLLVGWIDTVMDNYPCLPPYPITEVPPPIDLAWTHHQVQVQYRHHNTPFAGFVLFDLAADRDRLPRCGEDSGGCSGTGGPHCFGFIFVIGS